MHRSGTSAMAQMLSSMGVWFGDEVDMVKADRSNELGYFERLDVMGVNDGLLAWSGGTWDDPIGKVLEQEAGVYGATIRSVCDGGRRRGMWGFKDPRFCFTYGAWEKELGEHSVVVMVRHPVEVAESLRDAQGVPIEDGLRLWCRYNERCLDTFKGAVWVEYGELVDRPLVVARRLREKMPWLGEPKWMAVVKGLRHQRVEEGTATVLRSELNDRVREVWRRVRGRLERQGVPA